MSAPVGTPLALSPSMTTTNNSSQSVQFFSLSTEQTTSAQVTMSTLVALSFARSLTDAARKAESRKHTPANGR